MNRREPAMNFRELQELIDVDLQEAAEKKMQINRTRSWR